MISAIVLFVLCVMWLWLVDWRAVAVRREYKSGTTWCVWRWTRVESEYILRLHVIKTPWWAICLHWINKPDKEPWLHDHPVSFLSLILRGKYAEARRKRDGTTHVVLHKWFNWVRGNYGDTHRIIFARKGTLTLALMGPKTREWGFHVPKEMCPANSATPGWIMWKTYYARLKAGEDMRKEGLPMMINHNGTPDSSVYQTDDGAWFWCDETWAPSGPYDTREDAVNAQSEYIVEVLGV